MASQPKPLRRGAYIDQDTTDAFLDGPPPVHTFDGEKRQMRMSDVKAAAERGNLPPWPRSRPDA